MIASHSKNSLGIDYICGDVHGRFSLLKQQLKQVAFNPLEDRLFSLGDLINRGDESAQVLDWLEQPWFHAIQGNHERIFLQAVNDTEDNRQKLSKIRGGEWTKNLNNDRLKVYAEQLSLLPIAIEIELADGHKVGLVHAELPDICDWCDIVETLNKASSNDIDNTPLISDMLWRRSQSRLPGAMLSRVEPVKNISHVYHGHTIMEEYRTVTNRTFMDLGSYRTNKIGLLSANSFLYANETLVSTLFRKFLNPLATGFLKPRNTQKSKDIETVAVKAELEKY